MKMEVKIVDCFLRLALALPVHFRQDQPSFARKGFGMLDDLKEKIAPMVTRLAEMRGYL